MSDKLKPLDLKQINTHSLATRTSKVNIADFARICQKGGSFREFLNGLPNILAAADLKMVINAITTAVKSKKKIILGLGAHVIKVGLNPVIIELMERRLEMLAWFEAITLGSFDAFEAFGETYAAYARRVPAFLPRWPMEARTSPAGRESGT